MGRRIAVPRVLVALAGRRRLPGPDGRRAAGGISRLRPLRIEGPPDLPAAAVLDNRARGARRKPSVRSPSPQPLGGCRVSWSPRRLYDREGPPSLAAPRTRR